jgi:4-amino-4-deoxy-L-arabinose transferase-like glycosyltransferase
MFDAAHHRRAARLVEGVAVLAVLWAPLSVLNDAAASVPFNGDEGNYLCTTTYFEYLFVQHDIFRDEWRGNYWTRTQPMLIRYIAGAWLSSQGYDLTTLRPYCDFDWALTRAENQSRGFVPDAALVTESRAPMVILGTLAILGVYGVARLVSGPLAGVIASALALGSPLAREYLPQVLPEGVLILSMTTSLGLAMFAMRNGRLPMGWAVAVGALLGLGLAAKLTAALALVALVGWSLLAVACAIRVRRPKNARDAAFLAWFTSHGWLAAVAIAVVVFLLSDPYLYANPPRAIAGMFVSRAREMQEQQTEVQSMAPEWGLTNTAVYSPAERVQRVLESSLEKDTLSGSHRLPFELAFSVIGMAVLTWRSWQAWRLREFLGVDGLVAVTVLTFFIGTMAGLLLDWPRYYLPTLVLGTILSGIGIIWLARIATTALTRVRVPGRMRGPAPLA